MDLKEITYYISMGFHAFLADFPFSQFTIVTVPKLKYQADNY